MALIFGFFKGLLFSIRYSYLTRSFWLPGPKKPWVNLNLSLSLESDFYGVIEEFFPWEIDENTLFELL